LKSETKMLTIKNLIGGNELVPFSLETDSYSDRSFRSKLEYVVKCSDPSKKGQGVDSEGRFPWTSSLAQHNRRRDTNSFNIVLRLDICDANENQKSPCITIRIHGDFWEIMEYVFNKKPKHLMLRLIMEYELDGTEVGKEKYVYGLESKESKFKYEKVKV